LDRMKRQWTGEDRIPKMSKSKDRPKADLLLSMAAELITCVSMGDDPIGRIANGSLAIAGDRIVAAGPASEVASQVDAGDATLIDARGKVVAPGFVDCHTHLVFGGSRAREYALRLTKTAAAVEAMGFRTGIPATVEMTRATSREELAGSSARRLARMFRSGSTTVESKSGYGLSLSDELRILEINRLLSSSHPPDVISTFMGAHDFPPEENRNQYIEIIVNEMIPRVAEEGLAEFCDIYCDEGYYTVSETRRILEAGLSAGLRPKIHADAYSPTKATDLACELGAVSCEHLNYTNPHQMRKMAEAGVVGVVLPALDFAVAHPKPFDARAMIDGGMVLALATNLCPACWTETMHFVMVLACRRHGMSPEEAMLAATRGAAKAVARERDLGTLEPGKLADIQVWDLAEFEELIYRFDQNPVVAVIKRGKIEYQTEAQD